MAEQETRRNVTVLQAHVRGFLVRRRFRHLQAEYEGIVQDIEGCVDRLHWTGHFIPMPLFSRSHKGLHSKDVPEKDMALETEHVCQHAVGEELEPRLKVDGTRPDDKGNEGSSHQKRFDPAEAPVEKADPQHCSMGSTDWNTCYSEAEGGSERTDFLLKQGSGDLPHNLPELCQLRKHLTMEMLWLQQAIASRKNLFYTLLCEWFIDERILRTHYPLEELVAYLQQLFDVETKVCYPIVTKFVNQECSRQKRIRSVTCTD